MSIGGNVTLLKSYTMAMRDLPDIYARALGPQARGRRHIYQATLEWPWQGKQLKIIHDCKKRLMTQ